MSQWPFSPYAYPSAVGVTNRGMTLRDAFALSIISGVYAALTDVTDYPRASEMEEMARMAYDQADAMLKVRDQRYRT